MSSFFQFQREDIDAKLVSFGVPKIHTKAILRSAYKQSSDNPWVGINIPFKLASLSDEFSAKSLVIKKALISKYDASVKFLFELHDGLTVESVLMPETSRLTLCISSQVGCRQQCVFCHTGRMGLIRNLESHEIVAQAVTASRWIKENLSWLTDQAKLPLKQKISNVVFMGMGEPLDNVDAVLKACTIMSDDFMLGVSKRRITISTAGHLDGLKKLAQHSTDLSVALSLHATNDQARSKIMPINRTYPIKDVLAFLKDYVTSQDRKLMVQYTVIANVNDTPQHAEELIELLKDIPVKVNLIPLNPITSSRLQSPSATSLDAFAKALYDGGLQTMVRYSKGQDIYAACGQLVTSS